MNQNEFVTASNEIGFWEMERAPEISFDEKLHCMSLHLSKFNPLSPSIPNQHRTVAE
jgi:hypothetical protein